MRANAPFSLTELLATTAAGRRREGFCKSLQKKSDFFGGLDVADVASMWGAGRGRNGGFARRRGGRRKDGEEQHKDAKIAKGGTEGETDRITGWTGSE
jgi:hypothetical protein